MDLSKKKKEKLVARAKACICKLYSADEQTKRKINEIMDISVPVCVALQHEAASPNDQTEGWIHTLEEALEIRNE
jgi:hypothetical protein